MTQQSALRPGPRTHLLVWMALLGIVALELALTYSRPGTGTLLAGLLALAVLEAVIALLYFMHLRYERALLFWCVVPAVVFALIMLDQIWPDAFRLLTLRHGP